MWVLFEIMFEFEGGLMIGCLIGLIFYVGCMVKL